MTNRFVVFILLLMYFLINNSNCNISEKDKRVFKITIFYDDTYDSIEDIISYAVESNNNIIRNKPYHFEYSLIKVKISDSVKISKKLCDELKSGRLAVLTIGNSKVFEYAKSISNSLNIPYLSIDPNSGYASNNLNSNNNNNDNSAKLSEFSLYPPITKLIGAIIDLTVHYKWTFITVLFQEPGRIEDIIRYASNEFNDNKIHFQYRLIGADVSNWSGLIKDIKSSGSSHIIIDLETKLINRFLRLAEELGLTTVYYHLMFTTLDLSIISNTTTYKLSANVTALQVFEPNNLKIDAYFAGINLKRKFMDKPGFRYKPSVATFVYDALLILSNTINKYNLIDSIPLIFNVSCETDTSWSYGPEIVNYLKLTNMNGLSGHIQFDASTGFRTNLTIPIVDKVKNSVDLVGYWRDIPKNNKTIEIVRSLEREKDQIIHKLNRNLVVTTILEEPYIMLRNPVGNETLSGNQKYKGFCIDLLDKIAALCNFTYKIKLVDDGYHGTYINGRWNGIIGELIDKKADLAVAALTITSQREQVIDFSEPFLNLGISIMYKRPFKKKSEIFSFFNNFSIEIWVLTVFAYFAVSVIIFLIAHISPMEKIEKIDCKLKTDSMHTKLSAPNTFWLTFGTLVKQITNIKPKSTSTRLASTVWGFFTLILVSSYTANLAAFVTVERLKTPIENAEILSRQTEIKYGCIKGGATENFFKDSKLHTYERMWNFMNSNQDVFVRSAEEGVAKVKKGGFAYLLESTTNDYLRSKDCELIQIGGLLDDKGYGIGTPSGSPWANIISNAILQLKTFGELPELYQKWWINENRNLKSGECESLSEKTNQANELGLSKLGGVFIIVAFGLILAFFIVIIELTWKVNQASINKKDFSTRLKKGLKSIVKNFFSSRFENVFKSRGYITIEPKSAENHLVVRNFLREQNYKQLGKKSFLVLNGNSVYRRKI